MEEDFGIKGFTQEGFILEDREWEANKDLGGAMGPHSDYLHYLFLPTLFVSKAKVCKLIDNDKHEWNRSLIETIFSLKEVKATTSIPLSCTN